MVKQRAALDETLTYAPAALNNLSLAYNPKQGTLDTRDNIGEAVNQLQSNPAALRLQLPRRCTPTPPQTLQEGDRRPGAAAVGRLPEAGRHPRRRSTVDRTPRRARGGDPMSVSDSAHRTAPPRRAGRPGDGRRWSRSVAAARSTTCRSPVAPNVGENPITVHVDVPRRARPRARSRRSRSTTSRSARSRASKLKGYAADVTVELPGDRRPARTTPAPRSGRPASSARSSSR